MTGDSAPAMSVGDGNRMWNESTHNQIDELVPFDISPSLNSFGILAHAWGTCIMAAWQEGGAGPHAGGR